MLTIGRVAGRAGIRPSALRYYESRGVIRPAARQLNGYRMYTDDVLQSLLFVKRAQEFGIALAEIKLLLDLVAQGRPPCNRVKIIARRRLSEIREKVRELQKLQNELRAVLRRRAGRPRGNRVCPMLQNG